MNRLHTETSPYLLQHANNPVDWYPWGNEALEKARRENKPILLSIGYSACHWCHVMAHECFEDVSIADVMNRLYINIKVDREERPDLDRIYQLAHQALTQRGGGWPLTVFLAPEDQLPIFAGTYFPRKSRHGLPGFKEVLVRVERFVREQPEDLGNQLLQYKAFLDSTESSAGIPADISSRWLSMAQEGLERMFDSVHGGFGKAPKFPHPTHLERLLRNWADAPATSNGKRALEMARLTLHKMASGGLFDQLSGGFYRYSTDENWAIPHFEKMLYDNGSLLGLYAEAAAATGDTQFRNVAYETAQWVMKDMQSENGGYYATLDADSEGEEGKFYTWDRETFDSLLDGDTSSIAKRHWGLNKPANFEGKWHLVVDESIEAISASAGRPIQEITKAIAHARSVLAEQRQQRIRPARDEKILVSWNGLMIRGMAIAGRRLQEPAFIDSATRAVEFIRNNMWTHGRLFASYRQKQAQLMAYLDDYVFLIDGILALLEARWRTEDMDFAIELAEAVLTHFISVDGGFYFTADDHEKLIQRPRTWADEAIPAGNGIAAKVLLRLGYLLAEPRYIDAAESTLEAAAASVQSYPHAHCSLINAAEEYITPTETIILRGSDQELDHWRQHLNKIYAPARLTLAIPVNVATGRMEIDQHKGTTDSVTAYVCHDGMCDSPVDCIEDLPHDKTKVS